MGETVTYFFRAIIKRFTIEKLYKYQMLLNTHPSSGRRNRMVTESIREVPNVKASSVFPSMKPPPPTHLPLRNDIITPTSGKPRVNKAQRKQLEISRVFGWQTVATVMPSVGPVANSFPPESKRRSITFLLNYYPRVNKAYLLSPTCCHIMRFESIFQNC